MRRIVIGGVASSVCLSVTIVSPAKTTEAIAMWFWMWTRLGARNCLLDRGPDPQREGTFLVVDNGVGHSAVGCAKTAEPIEMQLA